MKCGGLVGKYCYGSAAVTSHVLKNVVDQLGPSHDGQFQASVSRSRQFHANLELQLNGDATIADGARADDSPLTATLARALAGGTGRDIRDCEDPVHPPTTAEYCGDGNAQGLASNDAANACTATASSASGLWFQIEQDSEDLDDYVGWSEQMASAIGATFAPVPPADDGGGVEASVPAEGGGHDDAGDVEDH